MWRLRIERVRIRDDERREHSDSSSTKHPSSSERAPVVVGVHPLRDIPPTPNRLCVFALRRRRLEVAAPRGFLDVDLGLGLLGDAEEARVGAEGREPLLFEPVDGFGPAGLVGDDGRVVEVGRRGGDVEPAVHDEDADVESAELEGRAEEPADEVGDAREKGEEPHGQVHLGPQRLEAHADDGLVEFLPEIQVLFAARVRRAVGDDVELAEGSVARRQRALGDDEPVAVVVDVREADAVVAGAEDAEPAVPRVLEEVRQE
mmetsp:Transcript_13689/g.54856  ORF Transcript_13689/g.54856 Transcript_13689/m.54856 type:complete len:260 (-) Transcript_13689:558-1337(-)